MKYNLNMHKVSFDLNEKHLNKDQYLRLWDSDSLKEFMNAQKEKPLFLLHDGPPYANGDLHLGHFTNKVLKDTLLKFKRLNGFYAPLYNGSDCHGLPVELAVEKSNKKLGKLSSEDFVRECYRYASEQVNNQSKQLKEFGLTANFDKSYKTTDFKRESGEMAAVMLLVEKGFLYQKYRPVYWCKDCQSSLAEAELEYQNKNSDSLTVKFKLNDNTYLLVWTTTPYTLPANQAVAFNKKFKYSKYYDETKNEYYVQVANEQVDKSWQYVEDMLLSNLEVESPYSKRKVTVYHADFVDSSGTGLVHIAPSFGLDDFYLGEKYNLETKSYVDDYGNYVSDDFLELKGYNLKDVSKHVLEKLKVDHLVFSHSYFDHEYPHCWRHKTPLFSKTSKEWFMDLTEVKELAKNKLNEVKFYPENGFNRLSTMLDGRTSWCVSRNRKWGVPLPKDLSENSLKEYQMWMEKVKESGLSSLYKDTEFKVQTLDVWFDSGMTHTTVVKEEFGFTQSDLYLEGNDQHRGWFQSSLLTSLALNNETPYKQVLTHGFVVDQNGKKLSKSMGNYVALADLMKQYSPDVLRVWALGQDFHKELTYSELTMLSALEKYKKFRNTFRFMLQNLYDYNPSNFNLENMDLLDKVFVLKTNELKKSVLKLGDEYKFNEALSLLYAFCDQLSALYLDSQKDRLYCLANNDERRLVTQNVLFYVQHNLLMLLSTYLPYTAEEYYTKSGLYKNEAVVMEDFLDEKLVEVDSDRIDKLFELRIKVNRLFEETREKKQMTKNNEMTVKLNEDLDESEMDMLSLMLGGVYLEKSNNLSLFKHSYLKCDRCWKYVSNLNSDCLCQRCEEVEEMKRDH